MLTIDRHIAIQSGWIAGPAFGVAMMAAPSYFHLEPGFTSGLLFWGGIGVFLATLIVVVVLSLHDEKKRKTVVGPIVLMAIGALVFCSGAAWYFWPREPKQSTPQFSGPLLKETSRFLLQPGQKGKNFTVDNTNPNNLTYKEVATEPRIAKSNDKEPPNVLSVFVHDARTLNMNGVVINGNVDLDIRPPHKFRLFYNVIYNFQANSKYLSVFVSHSEYTFPIVEAVAQGYQNAFAATESRLGLDYQAQGEAGISRTWEMPFSGRINVYMDDQLGTEQLGILTKLFKDHGASVSFYSTDYVLGAWNNIRLGLATAIDLYELKGNPPEIAPVPPSN
jgi:hypothetical protein